MFVALSTTITTLIRVVNRNPVLAVELNVKCASLILNAVLDPRQTNGRYAV
jgi:hypothetical protein